MIYKVRQGLQSARRLQKETVQSLPYIYTVSLYSLLFKHLNYCTKFFFLMIGTILSEYIIAEIIRDILHIHS